MQWRLQRYAIDEIVSYIRRVFRYTSEWKNLDIDTIAIDAGEGEFAFEQFFEENEQYPIVTVAGQGMQLTHAAFNNVFRVTADDYIPLGVNALQYATVTDSVALQVALPPTPSIFDDQTIRGFTAYYAGNPAGDNGNNIIVNLYKNFTTSPVLVASGSLPGTENQGFTYHYCELIPSVILSPMSDWWLTARTSSGSVYFMGIDPDFASIYSTTGGPSASGSLVGAALVPAYASIGGHGEGTIAIRVMSKNNTKDAYNIAEIIGQYLEFGKHAQFSRSSNATNNLLVGLLDGAVLPTLETRGVHIKSVRMDGPVMRRRGKEDQIYTVTLTADVFSEWIQQFPAEPLESIKPTVTVSL
jgi:hypothetical protein